MSSFNGLPTLLIFTCGALATALIKELPYWIPGLDKLPPFLKKCMKLLPLAAIGALLFPGTFSDYGAQWYAGLAGASVAFLIGYLKKPMILGLVLAIIVCYLLLLI